MVNAAAAGRSERSWRTRRREQQLNQVKDELADLREQHGPDAARDQEPLRRGRRGLARRALADHLQGRRGQRRHHLRQHQPRLRHRRGLAHRSHRDRGQLLGSRSRASTTAAPTSAAAAASRRARAEEIALVFDRNKGRIYNLYARALRDNAELQGKLVLEFTIAPNGDGNRCAGWSRASSRIRTSSEDHRAGAPVPVPARGRRRVTATKPIDFFPTSA